jgi:hypothetical protein
MARKFTKNGRKPNSEAAVSVQTAGNWMSWKSDEIKN